LSPREFAGYIDSTLLKADAPLDQALAYIDEAREYGFKCVVLSPYHARHVLSKGLAEGVCICSVIGFPMGFTSTRAKVVEAEELLGLGLHEVDVVMNIQAFKSGRYDDVLEDLVAVVDTAKRYGATVKVIVESPLLSLEEKARAVELVAKAGAQFIKTSTGVLSKTDLQDVYTLIRLSRGRLKVKASGGFRTAITTLLAIGMGVHRIGTSTASQVYREFLELRERIGGGV